MERNIIKIQFIVGSQAFFRDYEDFQPHDIDILEFEENPKNYKDHIHKHLKNKNMCIFKWKMRPVKEFIKTVLTTRCPMEICQFLVPEVVQYLGLTIDDLKKLESVAERLDDKHLYLKNIFESYIINNDFYLTKEQRDEAYAVYKKYRPHLYTN